jgi:enoyl-CoA hydratase/carnithine racemase
VAEVDLDPWVHAIVVTGQGDRHFCAGADLTDISNGEVSATTGSLKFTARL